VSRVAIESSSELAGLASLLVLGLVLAGGSQAAEDPVVVKLTSGHPEVAALLHDHPYILEFYADPMWREVVLNAPLVPGTSWQIHDLRRPQPPVVEVAPDACSTHAAPPSDAVVIFDGHDLEGFAGEARQYWEVRGGELIASGQHSNHLATRQGFGNVQIHVEFATPDPPGGHWQFRGNSGIFLMERYEIQILDSFRNPTYPDGQAGALYGQVPPLANASLPPGAWQCFDIVFSAPTFSGDKLVGPGRATLLHNGILIQDHAAFLGPTGFAKIGSYAPHAVTLPFALQDHGDPGSRVRFRNIWARPLPPAERTEPR
jgi:hypothetical protein